ncbi:MAG: hypothetical protein JNL32_13330, partial [Candidatus Kapabacteria bacterium]|nr:hypothetical protein [Candidatus Kapabacteria bacterium]
PNTLFSIPVCSSLVGRSVVRISDTLPERNTRYAFFTNSTFKGTDTIFCVGWENTIVMSVNKGKTWRTVSNFAPYFYGTWLNEAHGYMGGYDGNRVFRTIDSGATWLPQFYDKLNAKGQVVMIAFDSSGNGIIGNGDVLMTTPDSGNTYTPVPTGTGIATSFFTSRHYPLTMNRYAFINNIFSLGIMYCTLTTLDSSFKKIRTVGERNMQFISLYKVAGDTLRGWFFASGASSAFLLRHIMPGDSTWTVERIIPDSYNLKGISNAVLIDGHIIATRNQSRTVNGTYYSDGTLAVLNTTTGAWLPDTLHFQDKNIYNIFLLNNELYTTCNPVLTVSAEEINKHSSIQNFMQYTVDSSNKLVNLPLLVSSFSNVAIISSRVSQQNILYKVISATTPTSVEEELNAQTEQSYISVLPPYPNPARTAIRLPVYFQSTEEFGAKNCTVINNLGERLPESARISFNGTSPHSGELLWDCSGVPSGTYYMLISFGTAKRAVPILVVRE